MLHVRTLGELRQTSDTPGRPLRRKPLALLAYLARRAPAAVSRTELATLLWGERGEERARQSLRQALSELKQALGNSIEIDTDAVRLLADAVDLDIIAFEGALAENRLQEAVERWTGEFFAEASDIGGDGFLRWIENERVGLHRQLGAAMTRLIEDAELRGDPASASAWAQRWATAQPFDEAPTRMLVETLRTNGRNAEALKTHSAFVTRLRAARDAEPSDEFLRLADTLASDARDELARRGRGSPVVRGPAFVGREAVMSELITAWKQASRGTPAVVLLEGTAGCGLTRTCDELSTYVGEGGVILRGRGTGTEQAYAAAGQLFSGIASAEGSAGAAPEALAEVARLVPELRTEFPHLPASVGSEAALREGLIETVAAIAEEQPVLIVLDDLYDTDDDTRELVASLASGLTGRVLLVLAGDECKRDTGAALTRLRGLRQLRLLPIDGLAPRDVESMIASMIDMQDAERRSLARRLHAESGGLPHDIRALVTSLVDHHVLEFERAATWRLAPDFDERPLPLPDGVRERVRTRLQRVSAQSRALASAFAHLGSATAVSAGAMLGLAPHAADAAARELVTRCLLRESTRSGELELASPLLARAVGSILPVPDREAPVVVSEPPRARAGDSRRRLALWAALTAALAAMVVLAVRAAPAFGTRERDTSPIVAIGRIVDYRAGAATDLTKPLTDMLATNLGRVPGLRVVSTARMYELVGQTGRSSDTSAASLVAAARRAGATELLDGALYEPTTGTLRLDLRRVELSSGDIRKTHSLTGHNLFELADSGTAQLASDFGAATPAGSVADVTTRSIPAYRLYEQGLRAYYANDLQGAQPLFEAALREDSTFAMAAFYSAISMTTATDAEVVDRYRLAARLAKHTSDRERLTILAHVAFLTSSPSLFALADTLVIRYPDEFDGYYFTALALLQDGDFLKALAPLNHAVAMDSLGLSGSRIRCGACDALHQISSAYMLADSLPASERELRRWIRLQPRSPVPWQFLADLLSYEGRSNEALAALDRQAALDEGRRERERLLTLAVHRIYAGDFEQADRLLEGELESRVPFRIKQALWYRGISYRYQGRLNEALSDAREYRAILNKELSATAGRAGEPTNAAVLEAQVLYEMGRYRESARLFDSVALWATKDSMISRRARTRVWAMTHAAGALIASGDTSDINRRIDTIEAIGQQSLLGRDKRLHHYVRGLLLAARGDDEVAISEFRKAVWSWNFGYTRVNLALATALLRRGEARQAVAALQPVLRGPIEASNFYLTRSDAHELLGHAWAAVGTPASRDSAAAHFMVVSQAWRRADASFAPRLARARVN